MTINRKILIPTILIVSIFILILTYNSLYLNNQNTVSEGNPEETIKPRPDLYPIGIHISFQEDPRNSVTIMWITKNNTENSIVEIISPENINKIYTGTSIQYGGWYWHKVGVTGLKPNTTYRYRVGDPQLNMSQWHEFKTAPDGETPFTFTVYADQGINKHASKAVETALENNPDLHIHPGDLSYGSSNIKEWIKWFKIIEPLASRAPYMIGVGNHEYYSGKNLKDLDAYFSMPGDSYTYVFKWGNAYFITVDLGEDENTPPPENLIQKVDNILSEASRDPSTNWIFAYIHYPPYSSGQRHGSSRAASKLIPIFEKYGVDIVFAGHEHNYERTYPMKNGTIVSMNTTRYTGLNGTIYMVVGGAGGDLYKGFIKPQPEWSYMRKAVYSIAVVHVDGKTLELDVIRTDTGETIDSFTIIKRYTMVREAIHVNQSGISAALTPEKLITLIIVYTIIHLATNVEMPSIYSSRHRPDPLPHS
jgi:hypothetical protein